MNLSSSECLALWYRAKKEGKPKEERKEGRNEEKEEERKGNSVWT